MKYNDFRDLEVWQRCRTIRRDTWRLCRQLPKEERFRLADQMIRASGSATACIAEGYGRFHFKENVQFCRQARGSLYELIDHVDVAEECSYIPTEEAKELNAKTKKAIWVFNGDIKYLNKRFNEYQIEDATSARPMHQHT
jgi:four helix bundle protein